MTDDQCLLERDLNASKAEVERLKNELAAWDYGTRAEREQKLAEKAEAENQKLRELVEGLLSAGVGRMKLDEWRQLSEKYNQLTK